MQDASLRHDKILDLLTQYGSWRNENSDLTIVILHGWNTLEGAEKWAAVALGLSNYYNVLVPDLPGFGGTMAPPEVWGVGDYAHWVEEFLKARMLNQKQVVILGHSFGGAIAAKVCSDNPDIFSLVLCAAAIVRPAATLKQNLIAGFAGVVKTNLSKLLIRSHQKPISRDNLLYKGWVRLTGSQDYANSPGIMRDIMSRVIREDVQSILPRIQQQTLIIWGDKDTYTPLAYGRQVHSQIKNSTMLIYPGIDHGMHVKAAQKVVEDIKSWLSKAN